MTDTTASLSPEFTIEKIDLDDHQALLEQMTKPERFERMRRISNGELLQVEIWPHGDIEIYHKGDELPIGAVVTEGSRLVGVPGVKVLHALGDDEFSNFAAFEAAWCSRHAEMVKAVLAVLTEPQSVV